MAVRAFGLMSGGLDSMLAVKVVQEQGIEVVGITFVTPFFGAKAAREAAKQVGVELVVQDISEPHLQMLRNPRYGYGSQMNPCIDCHALMLRTAGRLLEERGFDFIFTGEVLGQRPMSQRRDALASVDKLSGYGGYILRPLSGKLLPATIPEKEGKVDRERLLAIRGRSRKPQMALARDYGIIKYPSPGGGCLLTSPGFAQRLRDLFATESEITIRDVELLKCGRHFRLAAGSRLVVGRVHADNVRIAELATEADFLLKAKSIPGPVALLPVTAQEEEVRTAAEIVAAYSDAATGSEAVITVTQGGRQKQLSITTRDKEVFRHMLI